MACKASVYQGSDSRTVDRRSDGPNYIIQFLKGQLPGVLKEHEGVLLSVFTHQKTDKSRKHILEKVISSNISHHIHK